MIVQFQINLFFHQTALMIAIEIKNRKIIKLLLDKPELNFDMVLKNNYFLPRSNVSSNFG